MQRIKAAKTRAAVRQPRIKELTPLDRMKLEIAAELGLADRVASEGWGMLSAVETGRVGGILNKRLKEHRLSIGPKGTLVPLQ